LRYFSVDAVRLSEAVHDPRILKPQINAKGKQKTNHNDTPNTTTSQHNVPVHGKGIEEKLKHRGTERTEFFSRFLKKSGLFLKQKG